mmetsp:Transcript_11763/g.32431  ORF Transcript_11763/g.32431 Transcript_11763/m.32431 type:complete len:274 (+) Transcript_11763:307-1128(+)
MRACCVASCWSLSSSSRIWIAFSSDVMRCALLLWVPSDGIPVSACCSASLRPGICDSTLHSTWLLVYLRLALASVSCLLSPTGLASQLPILLALALQVPRPLAAREYYRARRLHIGYSYDPSWSVGPRALLESIHHVIHSQGVGHAGKEWKAARLGGLRLFGGGDSLLRLRHGMLGLGFGGLDVLDLLHLVVLVFICCGCGKVLEAPPVWVSPVVPGQCWIEWLRGRRGSFGCAACGDNGEEEGRENDLHGGLIVFVLVFALRIVFALSCDTF